MGLRSSDEDGRPSYEEMASLQRELEDEQRRTREQIADKHRILSEYQSALDTVRRALEALRTIRDKEKLELDGLRQFVRDFNAYREACEKTPEAKMKLDRLLGPLEEFAIATIALWNHEQEKATS